VNKGKTCPSSQTLSAVRQADSLTEFICASQQATHQPQWSTKPWNWPTK
jgi:hypothetical protein